MINDKDIKKLSEVFVTKEDIKNLSEVFATKEDIKNLSEVFLTKEDGKSFAKKDDLTVFKNDILDGQDKIMEKLDMLIQEKTIGDEQDKGQKKVLEIHNNALKKSKILSEKEALEIDKLRVF